MNSHRPFRRAPLGALLALLMLGGNLSGQRGDLRQALRKMTRDVWAEARRVTDALGDDRPICVFPLLTPKRGRTPARASGAADEFWNEVLRPEIPRGLEARVKEGRALAELLRTRGAVPAAYDDPFQSAALLASVAGAGYSISGSFELLRRPDRMVIKVFGVSPGLELGRIEREFTIQAREWKHDPLAARLSRSSKSSPRSGFDVGIGRGAPPLPETTKLLEYVLSQRLESAARFFRNDLANHRDGMIAMLPLRSRHGDELTALSQMIERALGNALGRASIGCEELDRLLDEKMNTGIVAYTNDNLEPYVLEGLSATPSLRGRPLVASLRGRYGIDGNRLTLDLWMQPLGPELPSVREPDLPITIEYAELGDLVRRLASTESHYRFKNRQLDAWSEINRLLSLAAAEVVRSQPDLFQGKVIALGRPYLPAMNPADTFADLLQRALDEERTRLINEAQLHPEKWPVPSDILSADTKVNLAGRIFPRWIDANAYVRTLIRRTSLEGSSQRNIQLHQTLNRRLRTHLAAVGVRRFNIYGGDLAKKARRRAGRFDGQVGGPPRPQQRASRIDLWVTPAVDSTGDNEIEIQILVEDSNGFQVATSRSYRLKRSFVARAKKLFVTPDQVAAWIPEGPLAILWEGIELEQLKTRFARR